MTARSRPSIRHLRHRGQAGLTLVELLVAMAITAIILPVAVTVFFLTVRSSAQSTDRLTSSNSALQTNARFVDDIRSAQSLPGATAIARNQPGCGGDSSSVLRVVGETNGVVEVRSYSIVASNTALVRRVCSGVTLADALAAPPRSSDVTTDLSSAPDAVDVTCRANAGATPAPVGSGDAQCRVVSMRVRTSSGYEFTLLGERDSTQSPVSSTTTLKKCTLLASADTWVSSYDPDTNYGRETHMSVFWRRTGAYGYVFSFFQIDLLGPCTGPGEPGYLPGGKPLDSATLQLWLIRNGTPDCCGYESVHMLRVVGDPWDENTLTWHKRPAVVSDIPVHEFQTGRPFSGERPFTFNVLNEVSQWYANVGNGGRPNYGWRMDRGDAPIPDDTGTSNGFWWGSRDNPDAGKWPVLTVTWQ